MRDAPFRLLVDREGDAGVGEYAEDGGGDAAVQSGGAGATEAVGEDVADALLGWFGGADAQLRVEGKIMYVKSFKRLKINESH